LENGTHPAPSHPHRALLHNVGHGISRTGVNLKEIAGTVITTPLDIAKSVKRNVFGSADNIASVSEEDKSVGKSVFYDHHDYSPSVKKEEEHLQQQSTRVSDTDEIRPTTDLNSTSRFDSEHMKKLLDELTATKAQNYNLQRNLETLKRETDNEIRIQRTEIIDARFKIQDLNESMELYQNEVKQLKNDLNLIGTRMDYQYNDRFKKIEESVEGAQNRLYRLETNWHENTEKLLSTGQNMTNVVMLSFANIVVEVLKILLYFIAVVLDTIKPLTGTRKRAGIAISAVIVFFVLWSVLGIGQLLSSIIGGEDNPIGPKKEL